MPTVYQIFETGLSAQSHNMATIIRLIKVSLPWLYEKCENKYDLNHSIFFTQKIALNHGIDLNRPTPGPRLKKFNQRCDQAVVR